MPTRSNDLYAWLYACIAFLLFVKRRKKSSIYRSKQHSRLVGEVSSFIWFFLPSNSLENRNILYLGCEVATAWHKGMETVFNLGQASCLLLPMQKMGSLKPFVDALPGVACSRNYIFSAFVRYFYFYSFPEGLRQPEL